MGDLRYWLVPVSGYDDMVALATTRDRARFSVFRAGKEAGYFDGRDGFSRFLARVGHISEIDQIAAQSRIGGHRPIGAPQDWDPNP